MLLKCAIGVSVVLWWALGGLWVGKLWEQPWLRVGKQWVELFGKGQKAKFYSCFMNRQFFRWNILSNRDSTPSVAFSVT
jgi:hypothetical protein